MSLDASGTIAKTITFSKWKGRSYVRTRVIPHNPKSATQTATRSLMRFLTTQWAPNVIPDSWKPLADSKKISPFNEYVSYNMAQFTQFLFPSTEYPAARVSGAVAVAALTSVGGVKQITGVITSGANINSWGLVICISKTTGFTPARDNVALLVVDDQGTNNVAYTIVNVAAGPWFVRAANFNIDGTIGAFHAQTTATVTAV